MQTVSRTASIRARVYFSLLTLAFVAFAGLGQHSDRAFAGDKEIKPRVERRPKAPPLSLSLLDDPPPAN